MTKLAFMVPLACIAIASCPKQDPPVTASARPGSAPSVAGTADDSVEASQEESANADYKQTADKRDPAPSKEELGDAYTANKEKREQPKTYNEEQLERELRSLRPKKKRD